MSTFEYYPQDLNKDELEFLSSSGEYVNFLEDVNTRYIINALTKWRNINRDEIKFRISETSLIQFLGIVSSLLQENSELILSQENIKLFFEFGNHREIENFKFNCNNQYPINNHNEICIILVNNLIQSIKSKRENLDKEHLTNSENINWNIIEDTNSIFGSDTVLYFLEKSLIFKINEWNSFNKINGEVLNYQIEQLQISLNNGNFNLNISDTNLGKLYKELKIDFIKTEVTTLQDFINVFTKSWKNHNSIIYLKMDHFQTYLFWYWFKEKFNIDLTLSDIENSKLFKNTSAKKGCFTASTISASYKRDRKHDKADEDKLLKATLNRVKI